MLAQETFRLTITKPIYKLPIFEKSRASKLAAPAVHIISSNKYGRTPSVACQTNGKKRVGKGSSKPLVG